MLDVSQVGSVLRIRRRRFSALQCRPPSAAVLGLVRLRPPPRRLAGVTSPGGCYGNREKSLPVCDVASNFRVAALISQT